MLKDSFKGLFSGSFIKIIAIITMLIDHVAAFLINAEEYPMLYNIMRNIGRLAFPIFCFMIVEGFIHTKSVRKYLLRLFVFALVSEIPFDLASTSTLFDISHQNIFFTLFIGLLTLYFIDKFNKKGLLQILIIAIACTIATLLNTDYMLFGILQIVMFYYLRNIRLYRIISITFLNFYMGQPLGAAALIFTELYNGKRGINIKYFVYAFYPVHLMIIGLIKIYIL